MKKKKYTAPELEITWIRLDGNVLLSSIEKDADSRIIETMSSGDNTPVIGDGFWGT